VPIGVFLLKITALALALGHCAARSDGGKNFGITEVGVEVI
jgi:hypothetical protein